MSPKAAISIIAVVVIDAD